MRFFRDGEAWMLGFALLVSYSTLASVTGNELAADHAPTGTALWLGRLLQVAVCLAVVFATTRGHSPTNSPTLRLAATAACSISITLLFAAGQAAPPIADLCATVGLTIRQCGYVFLWLVWVELLARLDLRHALVDYLLVHAVSAALSFALGAVPLPILAIVIALLPFAAYGTCSRSRRIIEDAPYACGEREPHPWKFPTVPVALMAVFATVNVFVRDTLPQGASVYATAGVVIACATVLAIVRLRGVGAFDIWILGDAAFVLSLAGLMGIHLSSAAGSMAASLCTNAGFALFNVFLIAVLCNVSYRYGVNSIVLFGFAKAAECLAYILGRGLINAAPPEGGDSFALVVIVLAVLLTIGFVVLVRNRGNDPAWGVGFNPALSERTDAAQSIDHRCAALSREAGLTRREEEVLGLLARDLPASEIERRLCVTNATVKTHTQAVYRKLGVHSRKEIVDLVVHQNS